MLECLVSVVIPTWNRPLLVQRAVKSALAQTFKELEVLVVIDGTDAATCAELAALSDPRLKVIELPSRSGAAAARNAGVAQAKGEWIAFLDDDDEWLPEKLERQLATVQSSPHQFPIATCYLIARRPEGDTIWPRRLPTPSEPISEYLFVRNSLFQGEGVIQTSTLLVPKALLQNVPFLSSLERHQDWDWLLRVTQLDEVAIEFVSEPLAIWYSGEKRPSVSKSHDWQYSFNWIQAHRDLVTPLAYSSFILAEVSARAALIRDWNAFLPLFWEAVRRGKPRFKDLGLYLGMWLIPQEARRSLRALLVDKKTWKTCQSP